MAGINGIGGIPEPTPERPASVRDRKRPEVQNSTVKDGVKISSEAQEAANISRMVQVAKSQPDIRPERVEAAKQSIERGDYKDPKILNEIARALLKYLT